MIEHGRERAGHAGEFAPLLGGKRTIFEALLAETDPALVAFELGIAWAAEAGAEPICLLIAPAGHGDGGPLA